MNGTVTISLTDFQALERVKENATDLSARHQQLRDELDEIFNCVNDMEAVAKRYNSLEKSTYLTLKGGGWKLVKRQSSE